MRFGHIAVLLAAGATALSACESRSAGEPGPRIAKAYTVGDFKRIDSAGSYDVTVKTGAAPSVRAEGPQNVIENLVVEVKGDELRIYTKSGIRLGWRSSGPVKIAVTVPELHGASMAGSGTIAVDKIVADTFDGAVSGSGDLSLPSLTAKAANFDIAGSGTLVVGGAAETAEIEIAGSGNVDASKLVARDVAIGIAGSGSVRAHATGTVTGEILGSGDAAISGGAKCSVDKLGSGSITCS